MLSYRDWNHRGIPHLDEKNFGGVARFIKPIGRVDSGGFPHLSIAVFEREGKRVVQFIDP